MFVFFRYVVLLACLLISKTETFATETATPFLFGLTYHRGVLMPHNNSIEYSVTDYIQGIEAKWIVPTDGNRNYAQSLFRYPWWGIGYHYTNLGNAQVFGHAHALYAFMNIAYLKPSPKLSVNYQIAFGMAYIDKVFHPTENYFNQAIGSHLNAYIRFSTDVRYFLTSDIALQGELNFTHMSSGKMSVPNLGLNTIQYGIGGIYYFNKANYKIPETIIPRLNKRWEYIIFLSGASKYPQDYSNQKYPAGSLSLSADRYTSLKRKFGAGIDFFYDASTREYLESNREEWKPQYDYNAGLHISHDLVFYHLSWTIQVGYYMLYGPDKPIPVYIRTGLKYKVTRHLLAGINIKAHRAVADFIEFGAGYYWNK